MIDLKLFLILFVLSLSSFLIGLYAGYSAPCYYVRRCEIVFVPGRGPVVGSCKYIPVYREDLIESLGKDINIDSNIYRGVE